MTIPNEIRELEKAVQTTPVGGVLEIGSADGKTTLVLIGAAKGVGKHVYSVDPYPEDLEGRIDWYKPGTCARLKKEFEERVLNGTFDNITQFNETLGNCVDRLPELSVVFIDGLHEYESVETDLKLVYPLVVAGGRIYIHDTAWTVGQLSGTKEGGVCNIKPVMRQLFRRIIEFPNMIGGIK